MSQTVIAERLLEPIPAEIKITYQDYKLLRDIDKRYEVMGGRLSMVPAPIPHHQQVSRRLERILEDFVIDNDLGEVFDAPCDVVLSETDVVQPDIFFISKERLYIINKTNIKGAPDLVIEILSPISAGRDTIIKKKLYADHRVKEYWIVDPKGKTIQIYSLVSNLYEIAGSYKEPDDIVKSELLKGLSFTLKEIF
ncbi:Uma2 family endonuclease [bacterium]|nr:Uma2 family endonuclease [bacterium]MBU1753193.1 Uma2 family endonuclease [bacterium]